MIFEFPFIGELNDEKRQKMIEVLRAKGHAVPDDVRITQREHSFFDEYGRLQEGFPMAQVHLPAKVSP